MALLRGNVCRSRGRPHRTCITKDAGDVRTPLSLWQRSERARVRRVCVAILSIARRWITQEFVTFLHQLRDTPDPLGDGSLLDSTLVFWCSELGGSQRHDNDNMPFLLAGAGIRGGQYLQLNDVRHNRLLVTLCQYMGVNVDTYGSAIGGSGVIEGVLA